MEERNTTSPQYPEVTDQTVNQAQENPQIAGYNTESQIETELDTLYHGVAMRDLSGSGMIELRGNDVMDFLHRISTNSVKDVGKGEVAKTIFTTEKGRIIDSAVIINLDDFQILTCSHDFQEKMMIWLQKYVISDDVKLSNINGKYTIFEILGPQADSFMTLINGNIVNNIQPNQIKIMNTEGIIFFLMKHFDYNGQLVYWIIADPTYAQKLMRYMMQNKGPFNFNLIGEQTYNCYRVENGMPAAPTEINDLFNPHEVGLMNLVDNKKGCYIGQEVIARLETYDKVQKQFCGFIFSNPVEDFAMYNLFDNSNEEAGAITSSVYSYKFKKHIGIGFVKRKYFEEGTTLTAKNGNQNSIQVTVKKLPFKK